MITANQIICHLIGDYILQSHWMATQKTKNSLAALIHALTYSLPFLLLHPSLVAWLGVVIPHFFIDRFRLARYVAYAKNFLAPTSSWEKWEKCRDTGYNKDTPTWLSVWLMIITDNTLHLVLNAVALFYL